LATRDATRPWLLAGCGSLALASGLAALEVSAAEAPGTPVQMMDEPPEQILIFGRAEQQIGIAGAASEGAIAGADLTVRPLLRVAELLEAVPGLIAAQHSGSGKANQYFLRGMNLDHGTDFSAFVDDVPWNFRTHGHGQGYLDINGLIPETVARIDYRKGPYRADLGDFALAGAAVISTVEALDRPFASAEVGSFGWYRAVTGATFALAGGDLTLVGQMKMYDGPWEVAERLRHFSGYGKYITETAYGRLDASLSGYTGTWRGTEQIPERAIGNSFSEPGVPSIDCRNEFCAVDPTQNGLTTRWIGNVRMTGDSWRGNVYTQFYNWHMSSNPTLYLDDPVNGDQILQEDRRWIFGGRLEDYLEFADNFFLRLGGEARYDDISRVGVSHSRANTILNRVSLHAVDEASAAAYAEATYVPIEGLQLLAGLRADAYSFDVKAIDPGSLSGTASDSIVSPKLGIAYRVSDIFEIYGNWGRGFHSNDGRGAAVGTPPVPGLVQGEGEELGGRLQVGQFNFTAAYWWLETDSELIFVGDSNSVEPKTGSTRHGYELVLFWRPYDWLAIDAVYAQTHSRFIDSPGAEFIPNAPEAAGELGLSAIFDDYQASMRVRYHGAFPLIEDNSQRAEGHAVLNLRLAWTPGPWTLSGEILNVFDHDGQDIVYWYGTRLPGEPLGGVEDRVSRAAEPLTIRVGLKYDF
jgi:outer membrane receptor protein involved in Fe transport